MAASIPKRSISVRTVLVRGAIIGCASLLCPLSFHASEKAAEMSWSTGTVREAISVSGQATGSNGENHKTTYIEIVGQDYVYSAYSDLAYPSLAPHQGLANDLAWGFGKHKHPCRLIVGDKVKYAEKRDKLYIVDTEGKTCKLDVARKQRLN